MDNEQFDNKLEGYKDINFGWFKLKVDIEDIDFMTNLTQPQYSQVTSLLEKEWKKRGPKNLPHPFTIPICSEVQPATHTSIVNSRTERELQIRVLELEKELWIEREGNKNLNRHYLEIKNMLTLKEDRVKKLKNKVDALRRKVKGVDMVTFNEIEEPEFDV